MFKWPSLFVGSFDLLAAKTAKGCAIREDTQKWNCVLADYHWRLVRARSRVTTSLVPLRAFHFPFRSPGDRRRR